MIVPCIQNQILCYPNFRSPPISMKYLYLVKIGFTQNLIKNIIFMTVSIMLWAYCFYLFPLSIYIYEVYNIPYNPKQKTVLETIFDSIVR